MDAKKRIAIGLAVVAVLYGVSPVDLISDIVPVLGWMDDAMVLLGAGGNLLWQLKRHSNIETK